MTTARLSQTQRYFLDVLLDDGFDPTWQHVTTAFSFPIELDVARAEATVADVVSRHPVLSSRLGHDGAEAVLARSEGPVQCAIADLRDRSDDELDLWVSHFCDAPFDLGAGPLCRFAFVRGAGRTVWALAAHHLVADAASLWLLAKDLILSFFGESLDPPGPAFAEFLAEEEELLSGPVAAERLAYWAEQLAGAPTAVVTDGRPRGRRLSANVVLPLSFAPDAGDALQAEARARRVTPLPLLASHVLAAVKRAAEVDDVLSGVVTDLRGQRYGATVGPFTDVMLVRDRISLQEDESARLAQLRNSFFIGWQQQLPLAFLQDRIPDLGRRPEPGHNPCDVLINFLPAPPAAGWMRIMSVCGTAAPALFFPRHRLAAPAKRFHAPLYIFLFALIERLDGWIYAHRAAELAELNASVAEHLQHSAGALTALAR
ncbi:MAG: condensation domain-containing protein [Solirubrobacteraceae bacterium]